ncbi:MAG: hypothetical protein ACRBM6_35400 [Geminicoccales bacterium]
MDILANGLLAVIMLGSTHYIDVGKEQPAIIFYEDEDTAFMRFPNGKTVTGEWRFTTDGYFVDWADGPEGEWQIAFEPGRFTYLDDQGRERGDISQIMPGDPERLKK